MPFATAALIKGSLWARNAWKGIKRSASWVNTNFNAVDQVVGSAERPVAPLSATASPLVQAGGLSSQTLMLVAALGAFLILKK